MNIQLDDCSVADYEKFLRVKAMPKYRVVGSSVEFPDEYADMLGIKKRKRDGADAGEAGGADKGGGAVVGAGVRAEGTGH